LRGLQNSAGFLQAKIADRIDTRYTPKLKFVLDDGVKKSMAVSQILEQIAAERAETATHKQSAVSDDSDRQPSEMDAEEPNIPDHADDSVEDEDEHHSKN
jgi:ribosome-binding factor A